MQINLEEITENLYNLKDSEARLKFELKNIEKQIEKEELKLIVLLEQKKIDSMDFGIYSFGLVSSKRKAFDQKLFSTAHPDLFEQFKIEKEKVEFKFKIN